MCGIAGIIKWTHEISPPWQQPTPDRNVLDAMARAIAHRGPNGQGIYTDQRPRTTAALLHSRLAIIDLAGGAQPMANEDGSVHVVFNGEIYNHAELRRELTARGHRFATDHSDTEVLVHGWEEWGAELPKKLLGMFAFGIWDERSDTLFLARDRMGQKPLYYAILEDGVVFGSTIPSMLACPEVRRRVPRESLALYLLLGYLPPPMTIYRDVSQVPPGGWFRARRDVMDGGLYWDEPRPCATVDTRSPTDLQRDLRAQIERAVASQLIADVPIACFLSGGIDSSIVAAVMQRQMTTQTGKSINTISVGFGEAAFDESPYAAAVAAHIGSTHHRLTVSADHNIVPTLESLMQSGLGQPFADSSILPTYLLSQAARSIAPVALSGDGGDELFAGYDRYRALPLLHRWGSLLRHLPLNLPWISSNERARRFITAARGGDYVAGQYLGLTQLFSTADVEQLVGVEAVPISRQNDLSGIPYAMLQDRREYLPGDVLCKVDTASMAVPLEVRSPFMDHDLISFAATIPLGQLVDGKAGKLILRETYRHELPAEVFHRRKTGFGVPIGDWFRTSLLAVLRDHLLGPQCFARANFPAGSAEKLIHEHATGLRTHTHRLFALLMLELWWRSSNATLE